MTPKQKFPRAVAIEVVRELLPHLEPVAERLIIAGSLRRKKEQVGDIEILYIPKLETVKTGFWDTEMSNRFDSVLESLIKDGVLVKRENKNGSLTWGEKNKLARHTKTEIPVDFFSATPENWWNYLVCRTGGAETNIRICLAAQAKGWKWHPTNEGFTDKHGAIVPVISEQDVFASVGLPYLEPQQR